VRGETRALAVTEELRAAFQRASEGGAGAIKFVIQGEAYSLAGSLPSRGSLEADFAQGASMLDERGACYLLLRKDGKWMTVLYVPESTPVKDKMLYASSRSGLKEGLGGALFVEDFFISERAECTLANFESSKAGGSGQSHTGHLDESLLTFDERAKLSAVRESAKAVQSVKAAAIAEIPIKVRESAPQALNDFQSGKVNAVTLTLESKSEVLEETREENATFAALAAKLPEKSPVFLLLRFVAHEKKPVVFYYYCPDSAPPREKMLYSSAKSMVVKVVEQHQISIDKNLEITDAKELSEAELRAELNPQQAASKAFAKPKPAAGRGRPQAKFSAQ
jgi:twinfilin-like protein